MLKLIVSDIDGTLLPYGEAALTEELFALIDLLRGRGVLFCPASGRQYHSLRGLFAPIADEIAYLCENGAVVFGAGPEGESPVLCKTPMLRADAQRLAEEIHALPGCEALISGENTSYVSGRNPAFSERMRTGTGNHVRTVERFSEVPEDFIKVSAYCPEGTRLPLRALGPTWGSRFSMAEAGPAWVDFTLADKGGGLRSLCAALGVGREEVLAFGDNYNDLSMLRWAGKAYLMENASPELKQQFPLRCRRVEQVLRELLGGDLTRI